MIMVYGYHRVHTLAHTHNLKQININIDMYSISDWYDLCVLCAAYQTIHTIKISRIFPFSVPFG